MNLFVGEDFSVKLPGLNGKHHLLVDGGTNPSEKYAQVKLGSSSPNRGNV